ncbi:MAG: methyltransferase domain-containing protein [Chitinivibrionales bacterium]|nr:methyltransferase domain-containing protein [Chitinivibrionales bacterium]
MSSSSRSWFPDLSERASCSELMDDPLGDTALLYRTLDQFESINALLSGFKSIARRYIIDDMRARGKQDYRVADLGCGGGDFSRWFTDECRSRGIRVTMTCIDSDKRVVDYARKKCGPYPAIRIVHANACDPEIWKTPHDYAYGNHFLHHFPGREIARVIGLVDEHTRYGFLFNDIMRSTVALAGYTLLAALFFRKSFAFYDGRLSIMKGFRLEELREAAEAAGASHSIKVSSRWPFRCIVYRLGGC